MLQIFRIIYFTSHAIYILYEVIFDNQAPMSKPDCYMLYSGFLFGLLFYRDDGGDMFLGNVHWLSTDYTEL
jgi:hypothetical protein